MSVIMAIRLKQEDFKLETSLGEFQANLSYKIKLCQKGPKLKRKLKMWHSDKGPISEEDLDQVIQNTQHIQHTTYNTRTPRKWKKNDVYLYCQDAQAGGLNSRSVWLYSKTASSQLRKEEGEEERQLIEWRISVSPLFIMDCYLYYTEL